MTKWMPSDLKNVRTWKLIEVSRGEYFDIALTDERIIFGGFTNNVFLESGYILREEGETEDETLQELLSDLEVYYADGPDYVLAKQDLFVSRIVCNERM